MADKTADDDVVADEPVGIVGPPQIEFSEGYTELEKFDNESNLPHVVRYIDQTEGAGVPGGSLPMGLKLYADQPVLFHSRTCKRHISARTIYRDKEGPYYEVGQTLTIPEDFEGWFEMVPPDFGRAPYCRTIGQIAEIMPSKFFTRSNIRAIRVEEDSKEDGEKTSDDTKEKQQAFKERRIKAGTVLRVLGTFAAKWQTTAQGGLIKRKSKEYVTVEITYLKCLDIDEKEVLIPTTTHGKFSVVYDKSNKDIRTVYRMKDLISDFQLPIKVRMVYGKAPMVPCIFTGMIILKNQSRRDTIICSTVLNKRNVLFEMPINAKCNVKTAVNEDDYCDLRTFIDAQMLCKKYAISYSRLIKLSPDIDTDQQMILHIPTEKRKKRDSSLNTLDLITNISTTDDEPHDYFMESSDSDSIQSSGEMAAPLGMGQMMELREISMPRQSQSLSSA